MFLSGYFSQKKKKLEKTYHSTKTPFVTFTMLKINVLSSILCTHFLQFALGSFGNSCTALERKSLVTAPSGCEKEKIG